MPNRRFIFIVALLQSLLVVGAEAQSGRQKQKVPPPQPVVIDRSTPQSTAQTLTEATAKVRGLVVTGNIVHGFGYMSSNYMDVVFKEFTTWMKFDPNPFQNLDQGGKMTVENAIVSAKEETDNHVLWMGIGVEDGGIGELVVKHVDFTILMPRTGKVLTSGRVIPGEQRMIGAGGVLTVPTMPKRASEVAQLKQAARALAGRLKSTAWF